MTTEKRVLGIALTTTPKVILLIGAALLLAGVSGVIYGVAKSFSFMLGAAILYVVITGFGLCQCKHWAWLTVLCGLAAVIVFTLVGLIQSTIPLLTAMIVWLVTGGVVWYLQVKQVKQTFRVTEDDVKFLFLLPAVTWVLLFTVFPFLYGIRTSFYKVQIGRVDQFIWFKNFVRYFKDYKIHHSIKITVIFIVVTVTVEILFGLLLALLFNQKIKGLKVYRTIMLMPLFATPVAIGFLFLTIFYEEGGPLNGFLIPLGLKVPWLSSPTWSMVCVMLVDIWQWTPFCFLVILAGLQSLPEEIYQAASLDYDPGWPLFRRVTLPMLQPILIIVLLLRLIEACKIFDIPSRLTRGGPGTATMVYSLYTYLTGLKYFDLGYASVQGFALLVIMMFIIQFFFRRMREIYA
ncbi:binding-protein-dependent transport systems inner membrane component [Candidatus Moduliflexus flocculans]|uniref:Binding-protein-dependent transport systems inner membrane component n=1 Tax=Candidatus Moduliflexus flocculans TaxID=1499966 RepID=A0A081BSV5_9BACT|nr:binding-protein-dependent transport systems inner membrane component [Candidatus Moduliflexus flocculans]